MIRRPSTRRIAFLFTLTSVVAGTSAHADSPVVDLAVEHFGESATKTDESAVAQEAEVAQVAAHSYALAPLQDGVYNDAPATVIQGNPSVAPPRGTLQSPIVRSPLSAADVYQPESAIQFSRPSAPAAAPAGGAAAEKREAALGAMKGAYKGVFYANDYAYLNDPYYSGPSFPGDNLKGLLNNKLDIGGEARVRYMNENNIRGRNPGLTNGGAGPSGLGLTNNDDEFFLTRLRLFANLRINETFRVFGEYLYADSAGEELPSRPIEENRGEIQNLFLDAKLTENLTLRVGRQELLYGDQRLISPLDWANTRRTFSGARGIYTGEKWNIDGFFTHPADRSVANQSTIDDADEDQDFFGVYATRKGLDIGAVDFYYLGFEDQDVDFQYHTIGSRVAGKSEGGLLYNFEGGVQFGENAPGLGDHGAGFFTGGLGRQLNFGDWKPTVWAWYDWASGEEDFDDVARGDNSFDQLFPLGHKYLGFMDLFGRRNIQDYNLQFITPFMSSKVNLLIWYHYFRLDQLTTPYDIVGQPFNTVSQAGDRELGHEIDVLFNINVNPRNNVLIGYSHFSAGDYYDTTPGVVSNDADFFYVQYQTRF